MIRRWVVAILWVATFLMAATMLAACATLGPPREATSIPVEVENFDVRDATIYIVSGGTPWRIGRAVGTETTSLEVPRAFEHQTVNMAARFDAGGGMIVSPPFVVTREGFTMTIARARVGVFGARS